jgi:hypothetical protein
MFSESRLRHAAATESDGSVLPVVSRPFDDEEPRGASQSRMSQRLHPLITDVAARHADTRQ